MSFHARTRDRNEGCKVSGAQFTNANLAGSGPDRTMRLERISSGVLTPGVQGVDLHAHAFGSARFGITQGWPGASGLDPRQHYRLRSFNLGILVEGGALFIIPLGVAASSFDLTGRTL